MVLLDLFRVIGLRLLERGGRAESHTIGVRVDCTVVIVLQPSPVGAFVSWWFGPAEIGAPAQGLGEPIEHERSA